MANSKRPGHQSTDVNPEITLESTAELAKRARQGDREALDQLFGQYVPVLSRWARGRLPGWARDLADTSDVVQETVVAAFTKLESFEFRGEGALQAYLRQALMNRLRMEFRRAGRRPPIVELPADGQDPGPSRQVRW